MANYTWNGLHAKVAARDLTPGFHNRITTLAHRLEKERASAPTIEFRGAVATLVWSKGDDVVTVKVRAKGPTELIASCGMRRMATLAVIAQALASM